MGFFRGVFVVFAVSLLFTSILLTGIFLTFSLSLKYDVVEKEAMVLVEDFLSSNAEAINYSEGLFPLMELYCQNNTEYIFNQTEYVLNISCEVVSQGGRAVIQYVAKDLIRDFYYKDYECEFTKCFNNSTLPTFLFSEKAQKFWEGKFYLTLLISIAVLIAAFFLLKKKSNIFLVAGIILIILSLLFARLDSIGLLIPDKTLAQIAGLFTSESSRVFFGFLIVGIVSTIIGIVLKIIKLDLWIINKFQKKTPAQ